MTAALVVFGAPVLSHGWQTSLLATHMSLLGVMPLCYVHGVDANAWTEISAAALPFDDIWGGSVGTLVCYLQHIAVRISAIGSGLGLLLLLTVNIPDVCQFCLF